MVETATRKFHKLTTESGVVHEEGTAMTGTVEGVKSFLDQFEGDEKLAAALMVASAAAVAVYAELGLDGVEEPRHSGTQDISWLTNPEIVKHVANAAEGMEWISEIAATADFASRLG